MSLETVYPSEHVGFDSITKQIERRLLKRGFQFNLMVVGQSGLGKSTLINTLFASSLTRTSGRLDPTEPIGRTSEVKVESRVVVENDVRLKLNLIDTPGYGDQVNNERCWDPIIKYIKEQYSFYLRKELTAEREKFLTDTRVHCVLYFIEATGIGLKPIDIMVLKKLTEIVNVVPVIAKSDGLTLEERAEFKQVLQKEFAYHELKLYPHNFEGEYDDDDRQLNESIVSMIPFAVVGSDKLITIKGGKQVHGRQNRWGIVNVEDRNHCEFADLRQFLISSHLQDLIDTTSQIHYESFRAKQLKALKENSNNQSARTSQPAPSESSA